ncbi:MAG: P1 family peptidase [Bifidobacteriaceae bacterium]|jgi:L-aminopeptidase/D-esterase-like protein|nr:P1 family peptidase [Bifidobacteriaceae bacterium]
MGSVLDVEGMSVGQTQRVGDGWLTGVTVVIPPRGSVTMADVAGAVPATREVSGLRPGGGAVSADAIALTGGSSYGLIACHGVMRHLAEQGRGYRVGPGPREVVPIVAGAAIYDLGRGGDFGAFPTEQMGYSAAASAALATEVASGNVGAGTGATLDNETRKGGTGNASVRVEVEGQAVRVAALAVVNAFGVPIGRSRDPLAFAALGGPRRRAGYPPLNTVLAVVAVDAAVEAGDLARAARAGQDGIARAIDPAHTLADGDTVFAVSTGAVAPPGPAWERDSVIDLQATAARVVEAAIRDAIISAEPVRTPRLFLPRWPA